MAKTTKKKTPAKKTAAKKAPAKKPAKKKTTVRKPRALPFERTYKLIICRKLPSTGVVDYWGWGNRWSTDRNDAHRFARDFDAAQKMVEHIISHGKVIEDRA